MALHDNHLLAEAKRREQESRRLHRILWAAWFFVLFALLPLLWGTINR